ncbi:MAG: DegT/DnrJ/EryC1/StrS family aminotransferase [Kiritimatiellia bacterium]|jgi:dTDP-4-amino-4,6-dideoxygalactose transaminase
MYRAGQEEIDEVSKVILSKRWSRTGTSVAGHQQEVEQFEREWAEMIGTKYALLMAGGGTAALVCAMAGLGIGPGDEVIVPAYTWMATATAVLTVGAIPVLAEVDETLALDPADFERKITPNVKAVIPVHMMGRPANLEAIIRIAKAHGIKVIEDSCQMVGGTYHGKRTGSWGDAGAFSFNYFKIISAGGEGGALVTNDRRIYERAFIYHDSGSAFRSIAGELSEPIFVAQQYRSDEVMGAIIRVQRQRLDGILADLRRIRRQIEQATNGVHGLRVTANNDSDGDCGVAVSYQFDSEAQVRKFKDLVQAGYVLIDHKKHVFVDWEPLRKKRVMHHPAMNPFNFPQNRGLRMDYSDSCCPRTLEVLRRTIFIGLNPDLTAAQVDDLIQRIRSAAEQIAV